MVNKEMKFLDNGDIRYEIVDEAARTGLASKITSPTTSGTEGQVLTIDANGNPIWDNTSDMSNYYTKSETYSKSEIDSLINNIDGGDNSGLSNTAKNLLLTILKATVTNSNQASNIAALETELNSGGSDTPTITNYTITNTLTNCSNSNNTSTIQENSSYTATITASSGYTLDTVTVTMGGTDITSTVYNNGTISISAVTGNIIITASATINESEETEIELTANNQYILQNGTCNVSYSDGTEDAQFTNFKYVTSVEPFTEDTEVTATITHASTDQYIRYQKPNHFGSTPTAPTTTRADTRVVTDCVINNDMLDVVTVTWTVKAGNYLIMFYPQYLNAWDCIITAVRR